MVLSRYRTTLLLALLAVVGLWPLAITPAAAQQNPDTAKADAEQPAPDQPALDQVVEEAIEAAPTHPPAAAIDPDRLQAAARTALRNAIASMLARQQAEGNQTNLVFPPFVRRTIIDREEYVVRYTRKQVTRKIPVYRKVYTTKVVPVKDDYGNVVGYKKKKVVAKRIKIGEKAKTEKRLVRDPKGNITRTHTRPIWGKGGPDFIPRGLVGLNGMALYVMVEAGLADDERVEDFADDLAERIETWALPDHTFDLAWATAAFAAAPYSQHDDLHKRLISKLIDGQVRQRQATGMWGPIAIHHDLLARLTAMHITLFAKVAPLQNQLKQLEKAGEDGQLPPDQARLKQLVEKRLRQYDAQFNELEKAIRDASVLAKRLGKAREEYRPTSEWGKAGLAYYIFNRILADTESTALAAFAIAESARAGKLPEMTDRIDDVRRHIRPENTRATLIQSLGRLAQLQDRAVGGWDEANTIEENHAYDAHGALGLNNVPIREPLPQLPSIQTIQSNLDAVAAWDGFIAGLGDRAPRNFVSQRDQAIDRALAVLEAWVQMPLEMPVERLAYHGETDDAQEFRDNRGRIETRIESTAEPQAMPIGFDRDGYRAMRSAAVVLRDGRTLTDEQADRHEAVRRRLAYRLLLSQGNDGQWAGPSRGRVFTTSLLHHGVYNRIARTWRWLQKHEDKKKTPRWWRDKRRANMWQSIDHRRDDDAPGDLYPTLAASLMLLAIVDEPIALADVAILPPPPDAEGLIEGDADEDGEQAEDDPEPLMPGAAASQVERLNEDLLELIESTRRAMPAEPTEPAQDQATDQQPADAD